MSHNKDKYEHDPDETKIERDWEESPKAATIGGTAAGAGTGAVIGGVLGGPLGAAAGGVIGAAVGGGSGAVTDAAANELDNTLEGHGHEGPIERGLRNAGNAVERATESDIDNDGDVGRRH